MKTKFFFPTMLALIIQVMVMGQSESNNDRRMKENILPAEGPGSGEVKSFNETSAEERFVKLTKQASYLDSVSEQLKSAAKNRKPVERKIMMTEMMTWHNQSVLIQLEASEMSAVMAAEKFEQNKKKLSELMKGSTTDFDVLDHAQTLIMDSEKEIKMAAQIRSEAKELQSAEASLGALNNAEEKELAALNIQTKVIDMLNKVCKTNTNPFPDTFICQKTK